MEQQIFKKLPSFETDKNGKWYLGFCSVSNHISREACLFWVLSLWYVHRQSSNDAIFFYTYCYGTGKLSQTFFMRYRSVLPLQMVRTFYQCRLMCNSYGDIKESRIYIEDDGSLSLDYKLVEQNSNRKR